LPSLPRHPGKNQHDTTATLRRTPAVSRASSRSDTGAKAVGVGSIAWFGAVSRQATVLLPAHTSEGRAAAMSHLIPRAGANARPAPAASTGLSRHGCHLILNTTRRRHPVRGIQDFERHQVARRIIIENDTRFVFIAFGHGGLSKNDRQGIRLTVIDDFHAVPLSYFASLLVRYTVAMAGGCRSMSIKTRRRQPRHEVLHIIAALLLSIGTWLSAKGTGESVSMGLKSLARRQDPEVAREAT